MYKPFLFVKINHTVMKIHLIINVFFFFLLLQDLSGQNPDLFPDPEIKGMLEFEWDLFVEEKKKVSCHMNAK